MRLSLGGAFAVVAMLAAACAQERSPPLQVASSTASQALTAAPLMVAHRDVAVLLGNGQVLLSGGSTLSAELYDPLSNQHTSTGPPPYGLGVASLLLRDGRAMAISGLGSPASFARVAFYDVFTSSWSTGPSMTQARYLPTVTMLPNGKVLVAGGCGNPCLPAETNSAEIFDPANGTWTPTAPMSSPREDESATLVNGRVLAIANLSTGLSELYDFNNDTWSDAGASGLPGSATCLLSLPSNQVLLTSRLGARLFDPTTGAWRDTGPGYILRRNATATLLQNGKVLLAGGSLGGSTTLTANYGIYDPVADVWTDGGQMSAPRFDHVTVMMPTGRLLTVSGQYPDGGYILTAELFDPFEPSVSNGPTMAAAIDGGATLSALGEGKLLRIGGHGNLSGVQIFENGSNAFRTLPASPAVPRAAHSATVLSSGRVLIAGGLDTLGPLASCELFDPTSETFSPLLPMSVPRYAHAAALLADGQVLIAGGRNDSGAVNTAELYDPRTGAWQTVGSGPAGEVALTLMKSGDVLATAGTQAMVFSGTTHQFSNVPQAFAQRTRHSSTLLPDGTVLIAGGSNGVGPLSSSMLYEPVTQTFVSTGPMIEPRAGHAAVVLHSGRVVVLGGEGLGQSAEPAVEIFDPMDRAWRRTGNLSLGAKQAAAAAFSGGNVLVVGAGAQSQRFEEGPTPLPSWRPAFSLAGAVTPGQPVSVTGSLFTGVSAGSCGNYNSTPSNHPIFVITRTDNQAMRYATTTTWTSTTATFIPPANLPVGHYQVRAVVNGISSADTVLTLTTAAQGPCRDNTDCGAGTCLMGVCCPAGGCTDGGVDAGFDGGTDDAGIDAGRLDAGADAGPMDAGSDGGADAGFDGGSDAGPDSDGGPSWVASEYAVGCDCSSGAAGQLLLAGALSLLSSPRRRRTRASYRVPQSD